MWCSKKKFEGDGGLDAGGNLSNNIWLLDQAIQTSVSNVLSSTDSAFE